MIDIFIIVEILLFDSRISIIIIIDFLYRKNFHSIICWKIATTTNIFFVHLMMIMVRWSTLKTILVRNDQRLTQWFAQSSKCISHTDTLLSKILFFFFFFFLLYSFITSSFTFIANLMYSMSWFCMEFCISKIHTIYIGFQNDIYHQTVIIRDRHIETN